MLLQNRPKRVKCASINERVHDMKELYVLKDNRKFLDDEQVKNIWELALQSCDDYCDKEAGAICESNVEFETLENNFGEDKDSDLCESTENRLQFEPDMFHHYYPTRNSIYNRKQHFISFIQNYVTFDQGRKIMSNYESQVCDFIMKEMKPSSSLEFLEMMKLCKLSNVYRFHNFLFYQYTKSKVKGKHKHSSVSISFRDISRIIFMYQQFESFFHRNQRFDRKNFLSMRFVLGRILILLGIVYDFDSLDVDLQRPKGKTQMQFHMFVWNKFINETFNKKK